MQKTAAWDQSFPRRTTDRVRAGLRPAQTERSSARVAGDNNN